MYYSLTGCGLKLDLGGEIGGAVFLQKYF
jgi:hypothetical protein